LRRRVGSGRREMRRREERKRRDLIDFKEAGLKR
jgi:hypothetical protein